VSAVPPYDDPSEAERAARIDRLIDAIELVKANDQKGAQAILRELIRDDADFADAWLWMSVTVDTIDQASVCLDNVLRVNPFNRDAASALYRIRIPAMKFERRRVQLRFWRDIASVLLWILILGCLYAVFVTYAVA
jgi:hypothetical protein